MLRGSPPSGLRLQLTAIRPAMRRVRHALRLSFVLIVIITGHPPASATTFGSRSAAPQPD